MLNKYPKIKFKGIYSITSLVDGLIYVGSSINVHKRFLEHKNDLKGNRHSNPRLQRAYNKYGVENFKLRVEEVLDHTTASDEMRIIESKYCEKYNSYNREKGFNLVIEKGQSRTMSEETLGKIRQSNIDSRNNPAVLVNIYTLQKTYFETKSLALKSVNSKSNVRFTKNLIRDGFLFITQKELDQIDNLPQFISSKLLSQTPKTRSLNPILDVETGVFYESSEEVSRLYGIGNQFLRNYKTYNQFMVCTEEPYDYKSQYHKDKFRQIKNNSLSNSKYSILDLETGIYYDNYRDLNGAFGKSRTNYRWIRRNPRFSVKEIKVYDGIKKTRKTRK